MFKRALSLLICLSLAFPAWAAQEFLLADIVVEGNQRVKSIDVLNAMHHQAGTDGDLCRYRQPPWRISTAWTASPISPRKYQANRGPRC